MSRWGGREAQRLLVLVLETYGRTCHLCGQPIDVSLIGTRDPMRPSSDHLVPRSRGGSDALANLRPAHVRCNSSRQAKSVASVRTATDERRFFEGGATGHPAPPRPFPPETPEKTAE